MLHFKLPQDPQAKVIMIGAGTGVAPFRSFLFEREAQGIKGNTWLFFGEQHFRTDFLYQAEWQQFLKTGVLERMSVAFSRDQAEKIYVQHRLLEAGAEVYQWLQARRSLLRVRRHEPHGERCASSPGGNRWQRTAVKARQQRLNGWNSYMSEHRYQRDVY